MRVMDKVSPFSIAIFCLALTACSGGDTSGDDIVHPAPWVRTQPVALDQGAVHSLSGIVRGRYEIPVAFEVPGRITVRAVDAGQRVTAGQLLFQLDPRDLDEDLNAARAEQAAAQTALDIAAADHDRNRELLAKNFISHQVLERSELTVREARTRFDAARARAQQAGNRLGYGTLKAEADGVLMEVNGDPGQVIAAGEPLALLARDGEREVEVFLADAATPPAGGRIQLADGTHLTIALREIAGAADSASRTWRARYRLTEPSATLPLGSVVRVDLGGDIAASTLTVPIAAIDERGSGPRVWRIVDGRAQPLPVTVLKLDLETAQINAELEAGSRIISLGTDMLEPGMEVRELAP